MCDAGIDAHEPIVHGHGRVFYHPRTCLPVLPRDMDKDSESETYPEWMGKNAEQVSVLSFEQLQINVLSCR